MKSFLFVFLILNCIYFTNYSQKQISGKSKIQTLSFKPEYKRGLPPKLFVELIFEDANGNGIIEAEESAELDLKITNKGDGPAQGLIVKVADNNIDTCLNIIDNKEITLLQPNRSTKVTIPIKAGFCIRTAEHKLRINVTEHFGYDTDPAYLVLNTLEYQKPKLVYSGMEIIDTGEGTSAIIRDGQLQAGELVKVKIIVQNIGQNIANSTEYLVKSTDDNIYIKNKTGTLGDMAIGEVKEFLISISPNKRVAITDTLPVYLSITVTNGIGGINNKKLPLLLNQKPPETLTLNVKPDMESLKKKVARFEFQSNKFTANIGKVKNIRQVVPTKTMRQNSVAVIFGIEYYKNLPPAPYTENDANIMKEYFKNCLGIEQVVIYTSNDAKGFIFDDVFNPIYGELQKAILKGKSDLFVYYSGHGLPNKKGDKIYLFPTDGKIERIASQGYDLDILYKNLQALGAKTTTVFLDACFSGASKASEKISTENLMAMKGIKIKPKYRQPWLTNKNFTVFNSSSGDQTSLGFDPSKTGLFTYYLCAGMQGEADTNKDRKITAGELGSYIKTNVEITSQKILGLQSPEFHGNTEMILIEY